MTSPATENRADVKAQTRPSPWVHLGVVMAVFAITGLLAAVLGRVLLNGLLSVDGSLWSGPWTYRALYVALITPLYSVTLIGVGTLFGKHAYFRNRVVRIWGRILPIQALASSAPPEGG